MREWIRFLSEDGNGGQSNDGGAAGPNDPAPGMEGPGDPEGISQSRCASCSVQTPNHYCPACTAHYVGPGVEHKKKKKHPTS